MDYRLAPEYPYPFGLEDCHSVARHLWPVLDAQGRRYQRRLALAGDSGGGTLVAGPVSINSTMIGISVGGGGLRTSGRPTMVAPTMTT